jgi:hypothetical protein
MPVQLTSSNFVRADPGKHYRKQLYLKRRAASHQTQSMSPLLSSSVPVVPDLSTIRGVLFDIDGTLTNSDPLHFQA